MNFRAMIRWLWKNKRRSAWPALPNNISLLYHSIGSFSNNPLLSGNIHNVRAEIFHEQLKEIRGSGYRFISLDEFVEASRSGEKLNGTATVSFDDGYSSVLDEALPVLKDLQIPSTFFIVSDLLEGNVFWRDKVRYITQNGLEEEFLDFASQQEEAINSISVGTFYRASKDPSIIASDRVDALLDRFFHEKGIELKEDQEGIYVSTDRLIDSADHLTIGNHTSSHYMLSSLSKEKQYDQILDGERRLKGYGLDISPVFSVPFGGEHTYDGSTLDILEELGYRGCALSSAFKLSAMSVGSFSRTGLVPIKRCMPRDESDFPFGLS